MRAMSQARWPAPVLNGAPAPVSLTGGRPAMSSRRRFRTGSGPGDGVPQLAWLWPAGTSTGSGRRGERLRGWTGSGPRRAWRPGWPGWRCPRTRAPRRSLLTGRSDGRRSGPLGGGVVGHCAPPARCRRVGGAISTRRPVGSRGSHRPVSGRCGRSDRDLGPRLAPALESRRDSGRPPRPRRSSTRPGQAVVSLPSDLSADYDGRHGHRRTCIHDMATAFSDAADRVRAGTTRLPLRGPLPWRGSGEHLGLGPDRRRPRPGRRARGKLTRGLVDQGATVLAVEPVEGMRLDPGGGGAPGVAVVAGVAQAIPLGAGSVDALTVAQAMHWFATAEAFAEMHRVLRRGSRLAVVWNRRDLSDPLQAALHRIMAPLRGDTPSGTSGEWRRVLEETETGDARCSLPGRAVARAVGPVHRRRRRGRSGGIGELRRRPARRGAPASARRCAGRGAALPGAARPSLHGRGLLLPARSTDGSTSMGGCRAAPGTFGACRRPARCPLGPAVWRRPPSTSGGGGSAISAPSERTTLWPGASAPSGRAASSPFLPAPSSTNSGSGSEAAP